MGADETLAAQRTGYGGKVAVYANNQAPVVEMVELLQTFADFGAHQPGSSDSAFPVLLDQMIFEGIAIAVDKHHDEGILLLAADLALVFLAVLLFLFVVATEHAVVLDQALVLVEDFLQGLVVLAVHHTDRPGLGLAGVQLSVSKHLGEKEDRFDTRSTYWMRNQYFATYQRRPRSRKDAGVGGYISYDERLAKATRVA